MADSRRIQVDPGLSPEPIRPAASPVDTFVRPPEDNSLDQLSRALSSLSPDIRRFAGTVGDIVDTKAQEQGSAAAEKLRVQGLTLADATRKGLIPHSKNPFFMAGLREQLGRNMADKYDGDLRAAASQDPTLMDSTNISDYDAFANKFRAQWTKENVGEGDQDQQFNTGFQFRAEAYDKKNRDEFANGIEQKAVNQADDATFSEVYSIADKNLATATPQQIADDINTVTADLIRQGRNPSRILSAAARAVASAALNSNSLQGAEVLKLLAGKGGPAAAGVQLYAQTKAKISENLWTKNQRDREDAKANDEETQKSIIAEATKAVLNDPHADLSSYVGRLAPLDTHAAETLDSLQHSVTDLKNTTDQDVKRSIYASIWAPGSTTDAAQVLRGVTSHKLDVTDANFLMDQIDKRDKALNQDGPMRGALKDPAYMRTLDDLKGRFNDINGVLTGNAADRSAHAQAMLMDRWTDLAQSGKLASMSEPDKIKWLNDTSDAIVTYERQGTHINASPKDSPEAAPAARLEQGQGVPKPLEERLPKQPVLTVDDVQKFSRGIVTNNFRLQAEKAGIFPDEQANFVRSQLTYLTKQDK